MVSDEYLDPYFMEWYAKAIIELMILLGGFEAGMPLAASATALLLALGFLGLAHALVEAMLGEPRTRRRSSRSARPLVVLTVASVALMLVLTVAGTVLLPGSGLVEALAAAKGQGFGPLQWHHAAAQSSGVAQTPPPPRWITQRSRFSSPRKGRKYRRAALPSLHSASG